MKLEHSSRGTGWFRRLQLWATGDWQLHHTTCPLIHHISCRFFWYNIKSPRWLSLLQPRFGARWLLAIPKLKSLLKGKRFQTISEIQKNMTGQLWQSGELGEVPICLLWRRLRHHCPMCNLSLVSHVFFNKCLYFSYCMAGYFLGRPCISRSEHNFKAGFSKILLSNRGMNFTFDMADEHTPRSPSLAPTPRDHWNTGF